MKYSIEDYEGLKHQINPCPSCGKAPERNNCGPELQGVSCFDCDVHAFYSKEIGSNAMLLKAIEKWNNSDFDNLEEAMSMDYIPPDVDYTKSRAERRREAKERWYRNMKPTPSSGPNRKMRRSGKAEYKLWGET